MGVSFDAFIVSVQEEFNTVVVTPLDEASVVCIETSKNLKFLSALAPYTLLRVENTYWDLHKKRFVGGDISVFNVDYSDGFRYDDKCEDQV